MNTDIQEKEFGTVRRGSRPTIAKKTYGTMELRGDEHGGFVWEITCEPHVMIRLKAVITKVAKFHFGTVQLKHSPEVCRDLEWFVARYPLINKSKKALAAGAAEYRRTLERLETIYLPGHQSLSFPLALPARDYQAQAAEVFLARGGLLLADELGLGKSITSLAALTDARAKPALIVVQSHLPKQWEGYAAKFLPLATTHIIKPGEPYALPPADIYIITYHRLAKWVEVLSKFIRAVIFDEVQELRHPGTGKHSAAEAIRRAAPYAMGLSATPIYNYGGEIFNIMELLLPGALGSSDEFYREWCSGYGKHQTLKDAPAFGAYLKDNHMMVRRTRREVGRELPPVQTVVETIEHDAAVLGDLDAVATELAHRILTRATSFHEKGEAAREFDALLRQATGIAKAPFVAAFVKMLVESSGEPVVVTGWHRAVYEVWQQRLGLPISMFTGSETPKEKQREVDRFLKGETKVFVMSLRSGAGLDGLQERCSTIVHGELDWSPGVHEQCRGRLYRDGQACGVMEYFLVSDGGSDPIVSDVLGLKKAQVRGLLEPGGSGLELQADAGARVKKLAEEYLKVRYARDTRGHVLHELPLMEVNL